MGFIYTDSRFKKKIIDQSVSLARKKRETFFLNQTLEPAFFYYPFTINVIFALIQY